MNNVTEIMRDEGPRYAETNLKRFPVEPMASVTNLIFLAIVIYWSLKTKMNYKRFPLITVSMPILLLGFIGGTIYHMTRSHKIWLLLDYMPILILVLAASIYLWQMIFFNIRLTFCFTLGPIFLYRILTMVISIPDHIFINLGYSILALNILVPAVAHCWLKYPKGARWLLLAAGSFIVAILCRLYDMDFARNVLACGSHFLWHVFGGISTFFLVQYLYESDQVREEYPVGQAPASAEVAEMEV